MYYVISIDARTLDIEIVNKKGMLYEEAKKLRKLVQVEDRFKRCRVVSAENVNVVMEQLKHAIFEKMMEDNHAVC